MLFYDPLNAVIKVRKPAAPRQNFRGKLVKSSIGETLAPSGIKDALSELLEVSNRPPVLFIALVLVASIGAFYWVELALSMPAQMHLSTP